jgi:hypothetical protein
MAYSGSLACLQCKKNVNENSSFIECSGCESVSHKKCSKLSDTLFKTLIGNKDLEWFCSKCKYNLKNNTVGLPVSEITGSAQKQKHFENKIESSDNLTLQNLYKEIKDLQDSVKFIAAQYDDIKSLLDIAKKGLAENEMLKRRVKQLENKCDSLEQYSKNYNLEIKNVPVKQGEETNDLVVSLAKRVGHNLDKNEIDVSHRLQSKNDFIPPIIVKFVKKSTKESFMSAWKTYRSTSRPKKFTPNEIGLAGEKEIFVNEHLTSYRAYLFRCAKRSLEKNGFKFVWVKNGNILMRKDETTGILNITSEADIPTSK